MADYYTEDLSEFGSRERKMLRELLQAWEDQGLPKTFDDSAVKPALNKNSGNVFLTNENFDVAMMNGDKLQSFYNTPYNGHEGFLSDLLTEHEPSGLNSEDEEYIRELIRLEDLSEDEIPAAWQLKEEG